MLFSLLIMHLLPLELTRASEQSYKNVSFWLSNRGYGVFIDTPDLIDLEIGSERSCRVQTSVQSQRLKCRRDLATPAIT